MSKQTSKIADTVFPGAGTAGRTASDAVVDSLTPNLNDPSVSNPLASDPEIQKRVTEQVPDREKQIRAAAVAAGVTRSGNEADVLGTTGPKRKAASRVLLGSR